MARARFIQSEKRCMNSPRSCWPPRGSMFPSSSSIDIRRLRGSTNDSLQYNIRAKSSYISRTTKDCEKEEEGQGGVRNRTLFGPLILGRIFCCICCNNSQDLISQRGEPIISLEKRVDITRAPNVSEANCPSKMRRSISEREKEVVYESQSQKSRMR